MGFGKRKIQHDLFYMQVCAYLRSCGYKTESSTYHDHWSERSKDIIRRRFDPTSFYVRSRADNTAIPLLPSGRVFQWDTKTNISSQHENMTLEMIPLAIHKVLDEQFNINCLYAYYDVPRERHCGFWVADMPSVLKVVIPTPRWSPEQITWFEDIAQKIFPFAYVEHRESTNGSNTPYLLVTEQQVAQLPDWRTLIPQLVLEK